MTTQDTKLNERQTLFVACYTGAHLFNATASARAAGYKAKTENGLASIGYENLRKPHVWAAIRQRMRTVFNTADLSAERVLTDIEMTRQLALRAGNYTAALRASELHGKFLSMFTERIEHVHTLEDVPTEELVRLASKLMEKIGGFSLPGGARDDERLDGPESAAARDRTTH